MSKLMRFNVVFFDITRACRTNAALTGAIRSVPMCAHLHTSPLREVGELLPAGGFDSPAVLQDEVRRRVLERVGDFGAAAAAGHE